MRREFLNLISPFLLIKIIKAEFKLKQKTEQVSLFDAIGRQVSEDIFGGISVPAFDRARMDGYAVIASDIYNADEEKPVSLNLVGKIPIGTVSDISIKPGECVEVSTGGLVPKGADSVVMVEFTEKVGNKVKFFSPISEGENIVVAGSDIAFGELLVRKGEIITEKTIATLSAVGLDKISVYKKLKIGILSTGTELVPIGGKLTYGKIYDTNGPVLYNFINKIGGEPIYFGIAQDSYSKLKSKIVNAIGLVDILLISGGTSAGIGDILWKVLEDIGEILVHGVKIKPGKPMILAKVENKPVFGLPGYPTSAMITFDFFIKNVFFPNLKVGRQIKACLVERIHSHLGRRELRPVQIVKDGDNYLAFPLFKDTSLITSLSFSDGYIDIPEQLEYLYENSTVTVNIFEENKINKWAIVGSHCVGIDRILARLNLPVRVISIGSLPGIKAIMRKQGDIAGIHLLDEKSGEYNYPYVKDLDNIVLIRGYSRVQGVVTRDKCLTIEDIVNRQILFINRNRGSGTRILLDSKLRELAKKWDISFEEIIRRIDGYNKEVNTHSAVVLSIYHNRADAGIAIQNVAEPYNLKFTPIAVENFDFLVRKSSMKKKEVKKFLEFLRSKEIKEILSDFRIPENIGEIIYEK